MKTMLRERWANLAGREQLFVVGGSLVAVTGLLFVLLVDPMLERLDVLDRQIARQRRAMGELALVGAQYGAARARLAQIEQRIEAGKGTLSLLPYLEEAAASAHVRDRIVSMQSHPLPSAQGYKETAVELRLDGVLYSQLLALLVTLEDSPYLLHVTRLQIKPRFEAAHLLEATLLVSTYEKE
ncbi:MAG: type II secretion system protein M [Nitrospirota bacterium]|nr:type II secretion system protein M [Nitrospirota bacterium]MDE3242848.1 type II secretion system protein M [Nitrospirota bacterium]